MITLQDAFKKMANDSAFPHLAYRSKLIEECPTALQACQFIDREYTTTRQPRGFNLIKRANRKLGFVYYVRYWHEGKMLTSKWCTHTNDYKTACEFAVINREKLI